MDGIASKVAVSAVTVPWFGLECDVCEDATGYIRK